MQRWKGADVDPYDGDDDGGDTAKGGFLENVLDALGLRAPLGVGIVEVVGQLMSDSEDE